MSSGHTTRRLIWCVAARPPVSPAATHSALARLLSRFPTAGHVRYRARLTAAAPFRGIIGPAARRR